MDRSARALRRLLDLLAEGATSEQVAEVAVTARAAGVAEADLAEIEQATELALRLNRRVAGHERRQTELAALFDSASDLAGLRDLNAVLRSIVHRARMLLAADIAYLSLNDEARGETYMRVTDGSISARFQQVRLGMGEGLGGLVAQTARPYASADYASDTRFDHTEPIDAAVRDEGVVAILGVPLSLSGEVIGVLFAGFRSVREFARDEVALLSSLADHAAIAIDTTRLLEETRTAVEELNAANETIRAHNEAMQRAEEAHDRLTDLVLRGEDVLDVASAVASMLGGGIVVHDANGNELARVGSDPVPQPARAVAASRTAGRAVPHGEVWVCAVLAGPELLGGLLLTGRRDLSDADRRLFERAGVVTALLLLLQRSTAEAENKVGGELVADLLTAPERDPAGLVARARRLGIDLTAEHTALVVHADGVPRERLAAAVAWHARAAGGVAGALEDQVVLLPRTDPDRAAKDLAAELGGSLGCAVTAGAAGPATGPAALAGACAEARRCLRALLALGRTGDGAAMADLGFLGVVLGDRSDPAGFVRSVLGPVLDYDEQRGTDLVGTLDAYFASGANLNRTKDVLHVHVNTVAQRLERVRALLGEDWQAHDRALELQLALRLHKIAAPDRGAG
ncbi:helix-turn-helix domain-containing protein [Saccharopolyspora griseoalba]|uniref:Helix-turn-helix domain-containing protein n=1 Tax=Saccharopolyspora griseoalba TaxID=1431848 RepID=A0ABW2LTQ4_9PSEU